MIYVLDILLLKNNYNNNQLEIDRLSINMHFSCPFVCLYLLWIVTSTYAENNKLASV